VAGEPTIALATSDLSIYYETGVKLFQQETPIG